MSWWTRLRDSIESVASVAGNYFLPGSGLITSNLVSKGSQDQLGSTLGRVAMLGSGIYGGLPTSMGGAGNMANYGKIFDATGNFLSGGQDALSNMFSSGAAGTASNTPEFKNLFDAYISNGATPSEALQYTQDVMSRGNSAPTDWTKYLTSPQGIGTGVNAVSNLLGAYATANAAKSAAQKIADANITSNQLMADQYRQQTARSEPFYQAGLAALPAYTQGVMPGGDLVRPFSLADYTKDPGAAFREKRSLDEYASRMASMGLRDSGPMRSGIVQRAGDFASQEYGNAYSRYGQDQATRRNALASLTGFAPTAAATMGAAGNTYAANTSTNNLNTAVTQANAGMTDVNAYGSAYKDIGTGVNSLLNPNPLNAWLMQQINKTA